jgi:CheY-like chemotaxis protein
VNLPLASDKEGASAGQTDSGKGVGRAPSDDSPTRLAPDRDSSPAPPYGPLAREEGDVHPLTEGGDPCDNRKALDGLRVLVVDDELDTREMLSAALSQCSAEVRVAASAGEGVEELERWRPHVLVADIGMPVEDGYDMIQRIRKLGPERGGQTPAIALTAYARIEDRERALASGYQEHVPKPVEPDTLVEIIARLAGRGGAA